jgi:hypothetical protein
MWLDAMDRINQKNGSAPLYKFYSFFKCHKSMFIYHMYHLKTYILNHFTKKVF